MDANDKAQDPGTRAPAKSVRTELDAVDLTPLEELDRMRHDLTKVEEYRAKAAALKGQVAPAVWQKVVDDYSRRAGELERQAQPLRDKAIGECRKLQVIASRVIAACEQTEMVKVELEFRHAVGELDDAQFSKKLEGPLATLERAKDEKRAVDEYKERFVNALGGTWDSILAAAPSSPQPQAPAPAPQPAAAGNRSEMTNVMPMPSIHESGKIPAAPAVAPNDDEAAPTVVVPPAALLLGSAGATQTVHRLAALNYLGRAEDNQIRMTQQGVSRKHALISVTPKGFSIKDLNSQNGTFVNGGRITERVLNDGDSIDIGHAKLVFRSPWPAGAAAGSESSRR